MSPPHVPHPPSNFCYVKVKACPSPIYRSRYGPVVCNVIITLNNFMISFFFGTSVLFTNATVTSRFKVKEWIASGKKTHMCTARPGWQTISLRSPKYKKTMWNVHVNLIDVLKVKLHGFNNTVHKLLQACCPFNKICSSLICSCQSFANRALTGACFAMF